MSSARAIAVSRTPDRHGSAAAARLIGADSETSFAAVLGNAAIASQSAPPSLPDHGKPIAAHPGGGAEAASPPVTDRSDPGAAPSSPAAAQTPEVAPTLATAIPAALSPSTAPSPAAGRESLGDDPDAAAGGPAGSPGLAVGSRFHQSESDPPTAPDRVSHNPTIGSRDLAPPDRDAVKEGQGLSSWPQNDSSTANATAATGPQPPHSPQRRQNRESIAIDAPLVMPTNIALSAVPAGEPALPAVFESKAEGSVALPIDERDQPTPVMGAGGRAGLPHNSAAPSQASPDQIQPRANLPDAADSGALTMLGAVAAFAGDARSTGLSGLCRLDPKPVDGTLAAAPKIASDVTLTADFRLATQGGDSAAPDISALASTVAGTAAASPAPAAPAPENPPNLSASNLTLGDISDQLSSHLLRSIQNPDHNVVLRLNPPELGDLTIRVVVSGREVSAWFATPQAQVQQAISQAIGQLHTSLGNAGYDLAGAWVGADASNPRERDSSLPSARPGGAPARAEPITAPQPSPGAKTGRGVSIYV